MSAIGKSRHIADIGFSAGFDPGRVEIVGKPAQFGSRRRLSSPIELLIINDLRTTLEAPGSFR
jgi:hypothetical protein